MATIELRSPRIVVRRVGAGKLVDGQLGAGVLVKDDIVLITPDAASVLLTDDPPEAEIYLAPRDLDGDAVVEHRGITWLQAIELSDEIPHRTDQGYPAYAGLDAPSVFTPVARRPDLDALERVVREGADLWTGLEDAGMIPTGYRRPEDPRWIHRVEELLRLRRRPGIKRPIRFRPEDLSCVFLPWTC